MRSESRFLAVWRFHEGDIEMPPVRGHEMTYLQAKTGEALAAASPSFCDRSWRRVEVPHDWAVEQAHDPTANLSQGYRPRGLGWYRTHFRLPQGWQEGFVEVEFGAIASRADIWLNGCHLLRGENGYLPLRADIGALAYFGEGLNTLAVRVDATPQDGWWYEGAGLYREVVLRFKPRLHIETDGVHVLPTRDNEETWRVTCHVRLRNAGETAQSGRLVWDLETTDGHKVTGGEVSSGVVSAWGEGSISWEFVVKNPALWSPEEPSLYRLRISLLDALNAQDQVEVMVGFRTVRFDSTQGMLLNGRPYKIHGVCCHQDHAGVGVAVPRSLLEWRLRQLKSFGANAYRCAHHPPSRDLLSLCDRLGMLVLDETRVFSSSPLALRHLEEMIVRDRNHPSVFLWSIANEEVLQSSALGVAIAKRMVARIRELDPTRPVTAAMNGGFFARHNLASAVDVVGFNYQSHLYGVYHESFPTRLMISTEDISGWMIRGETRSDPSAHLVAAYDEDYAPWGTSQREGWRRISELPAVAGGFIWTGIDYHGEPSPFDWPTNSSLFGVLDLCGFPKTAYYIKRCHWLPGERTLFVFPHWNEPAEGNGRVRVLVVTNAERVTLRLNGRELGTRMVEAWDFPSWELLFEPGTLEAEATWADGATLVERVETTGEAVRLALDCPMEQMVAERGWTVPVRVCALDEADREVPDAKLVVEFAVDGPGKIVGLGNGDPNSLEPEKGNRRSLFHGLAQVLLAFDAEAGAGTPAEITLRASAPGVAGAELRWGVRAAETARPEIELLDGGQILKLWRISPPLRDRPDLDLRTEASDMNSWEFLAADAEVRVEPGRYVLLRYTAPVNSDGGPCRLVFPRMPEMEELLVNGERKDLPREEGKVEMFCEAAPREILFLLRARDRGWVGFPYPPYLGGQEPGSR
ncbi:MAG: glycoside hydrolase family 2 TIM barrel-domain containing protein [Verrucomicrobiia bacterium]